MCKCAGMKGWPSLLCVLRLPCLHLHPQCKCICYKLENDLDEFARIMCKLIVSNNWVSVKWFSYEENQVPFNKDLWYLILVFYSLLVWPTFRTLAVCHIIEGVEQVRCWKSLIIQMLSKFLGPVLSSSCAL